MELSDGEKLILTMLCDLHRHLEVKGSVDPELVLNAIEGAHYWGLERQYTFIFRDDQVDDVTLKETYDILDMWTTVELDFAALSQTDQARVAAEAAIFGKDPKFNGFDGNSDERHMSVAVFLIEKLNLYSNFAGRNMNSHGMPSIDDHRRMLAAFKPMRPGLRDADMDADQIIKVLG